MSSRGLQQHSRLASQSQDLIRLVMSELNLSVRSYGRILKVSRYELVSEKHFCAKGRPPPTGYSDSAYVMDKLTVISSHQLARVIAFIVFLVTAMYGALAEVSNQLSNRWILVPCP